MHNKYAVYKTSVRSTLIKIQFILINLQAYYACILTHTCAIINTCRYTQNGKPCCNIQSEYRSSEVFNSIDQGPICIKSNMCKLTKINHI